MMKTKQKKRLRSQAGETIAEVLIALLISVLALTMLAMMISSTVGLVNASKEKMNDYYTGNAVLEMQTASAGTVEVKIEAEDRKVNITMPSVNLFENTVFNKTVYAYGTNQSGS